MGHIGLIVRMSLISPMCPIGPIDDSPRGGFQLITQVSPLLINFSKLPAPFVSIAVEI